MTAALLLVTARNTRTAGLDVARHTVLEVP